MHINHQTYFHHSYDFDSLNNFSFCNTSIVLPSINTLLLSYTIKYEVNIASSELLVILIKDTPLFFKYLNKSLTSSSSKLFNILKNITFFNSTNFSLLKLLSIIV